MNTTIVIITALFETISFALEESADAVRRSIARTAQWIIGQAAAAADGTPSGLGVVGRRLRPQFTLRQLGEALVPQHPMERLLVAARLTLASVAVIGLWTLWPQINPTPLIQSVAAALPTVSLPTISLPVTGTANIVPTGAVAEGSTIAMTEGPSPSAADAGGLNASTVDLASASPETTNGPATVDLPESQPLAQPPTQAPVQVAVIDVATSTSIPTATATATSEPTFTATSEPTFTATPTSTPLPTETPLYLLFDEPTALPTWTRTALPAATPTAPPTATPTPTEIPYGPAVVSAANVAGGVRAMLGMEWLATAATNAAESDMAATVVKSQSDESPIGEQIIAQSPDVADGVKKPAAQPQVRQELVALLTPTATPTVTPLPTPLPTINPAIIEAWNADLYRPTPTMTPTPMPIIRPTVEVVAVPAIKGRIWPDFVPASAETADHYWLGRPYASNVGNQFATPLYPFGSTGGGRYLLHHGVDMGNPYGTPLVAAATGEVIFATWDTEQVLGPYPNFYGLAVVIKLDQRLSTPSGEKDIFVLYGHLSDVTVGQGQRVEAGDPIGYVGMSGIALGPHLHLEVRVGNNDYISTVNPWLWMRPFSGMGTLAVRLLSADGSTWQGAKLSLIQLTAQGSKWVRTLITYLDAEEIGPDPTWGENSVMGDLPAGEYMIVGKINDERVEARVTIRSGQTSFVEMRTQNQ